MWALCRAYRVKERKRDGGVESLMGTFGGCGSTEGPKFTFPLPMTEYHNYYKRYYVRMYWDLEGTLIPRIAKFCHGVWPIEADLMFRCSDLPLHEITMFIRLLNSSHQIELS